MKKSGQNVGKSVKQRMDFPITAHTIDDDEEEGKDDGKQREGIF